MTNNIIGATGGRTGTGQNVISNSAGDAISQVQAGDGNQYLRNLGRNNGSGPSDLFVDIANNGPGNPNNNQTNNGILRAERAHRQRQLDLRLERQRPERRHRPRLHHLHGPRRHPQVPRDSDRERDRRVELQLPELAAQRPVRDRQPDRHHRNNSSELAMPVAIGGGPCVAPPFTTIDSGPLPGSTIAQPIAQFQFSSPEAGAAFQCRIDSGSFDSCASPFTTLPLADGSHTLHVRATITTDARARHRRRRDGQPHVHDRHHRPDDDVRLRPRRGQHDRRRPAPASASARTRPGSSFECKLDNGSFSACSTPFTVSSLADGSHTVEVRATDPVGNVGPTATRSFSVDPPDTTAPNTKIGKVKVNGNTATVNFSATDATAAGASGASGISFQCKLDKGKFKPCKSPKKYRRLKEGRHTVKIKAIDAAGNIDSTPATKRFRI